MTPVAVHTLLELTAFAVGIQLYRRGRRQSHDGPLPADLLAPPGAWVSVGCVFGALIGSKLVSAIETPNVAFTSLATILSGQSMVGGLIGGWLGVEAAKRATGITASTGDLFVLPLTLGLAIGRIGCFLAGLADGTHGVPTDLPWAVDFGDGIPRHPTQLYEIAFVLALAPIRFRTTGLRFRVFFDAYLLWRLGIETLKPLPFAYPGGLHGIQLACLAALAAHLPKTIALLASRRRLAS